MHIDNPNVVANIATAIQAMKNPYAAERIICRPAAADLTVPISVRPKLSIIDATVAYREAAKGRLTETELVQRLEGELDRAKDALANAERRFRDAKEDLLRTAADEQADIL